MARPPEPKPNERLIVDGEEFLWSDERAMVSCRWSLWRSIGQSGSRRMAVVQPTDHRDEDLMAIAADTQFELMLDPVNQEVTRGARVTIDGWSVLSGDGDELKPIVARALVPRVVDEASHWRPSRQAGSSSVEDADAGFSDEDTQ